jgi:hypothetical protein
MEEIGHNVESIAMKIEQGRGTLGALANDRKVDIAVQASTRVFIDAALTA